MTIARLIADRSFAVESCETTTRVRHAVSTLAGKRIGAMPVLEEGRVCGIFSERDVIYQLHSHGPAILDKTVGEVMTAPAVTVSPDTDIMAALALMTRRRIRHLPVEQDGQMVGFVSIGDLVKFRIDRIEAEAEAMRAYIQTA